MRVEPIFHPRLLSWRLICFLATDRSDKAREGKLLAEMSPSLAAGDSRQENPFHRYIWRNSACSSFAEQHKTTCKRAACSILTSLTHSSQPRTGTCTAASTHRKKRQKRATRALCSGLWPVVKQQVFLGMAASSVPVRKEVPELMEDLTAAGVRFVYFSPRNMRRSKLYC